MMTSRFVLFLSLALAAAACQKDPITPAQPAPVADIQKNVFIARYSNVELVCDYE